MKISPFSGFLTRVSALGTASDALATLFLFICMDANGSEIRLFRTRRDGVIKFGGTRETGEPGQLPGFFAPDDPACYFDCIVVSGEVGVAKPSTGIYELAEQKLHARPEDCIMVDDSAANCQGARAAGMSAICFESREACIEELLRLLPNGILGRSRTVRRWSATRFGRPAAWPSGRRLAARLSAAAKRWPSWRSAR